MFYLLSVEFVYFPFTVPIFNGSFFFFCIHIYLDSEKGHIQYGYILHVLCRAQIDVPLPKSDTHMQKL